MASQSGFCGEGCSFETVDVDCSMAFRMVESTIRRIMGGLRDRTEDEVIFAGWIKSDRAVSAVADSQPSSSKFLSSIAPQPTFSNTSSAPQSPFVCSSSAPLLPQLQNILQGLEASSLRGSPPAVSTPPPSPGREKESVSCIAKYVGQGPTPQPLRRLSSLEVLVITASAVPSQGDQIRRDSLVRAKGELQPFRLCCVVG